MSKRVGNRSGKGRKRTARSQPKVPKWVKRKPFAFDPVKAIDDLMKR